MSITENLIIIPYLLLVTFYYLCQLIEFMKQIIKNERSMLKSEFIFSYCPKWQCNFPLTLTVLRFEV